MSLPEGYKFIFVDWSKEMPVYVRKEDGTDVAVISCDASGAYVDVKNFKFMYSDGVKLFGRPVEGDDVQIVLKAGDQIILG